MEGMQAGFWCGGTVAPIGRTAKSVAGSRTGLIGGGFCRGKPVLSMGHHPVVAACASSSPAHIGGGAMATASTSDCRIGSLEKLQAPDVALPPRRLVQRSDHGAGEMHRQGDETIEASGDERRFECDSQHSSTPSTSSGCPVYVMLPLDTVWLVEKDGRSVAIIKKEKALELALHTFKQSGVEGVMVDVWWGIVERDGPKQYDFSAYKRLFRKVSDAGLKIQAVMSFHSAGGNVGDTCKVPLPQWVLDVGESDPDIFYTDKELNRNQECLSLGCDAVPLFFGRTPIEMYRDFAAAFASTFHGLLGSEVTEITVGLGPAGELRYPAYPEGDGRWRFPGVGEFQCYDKYMLQDLERCAKAAGHPEWAYGGPHDAGSYNSKEWETGFFGNGGRFDSAYGHFFLSWYSGLLLEHADNILSAVSGVLHGAGRKKVLRSMKKRSNGCWVHEFEAACQLGVKLAGVHWWFKTQSHAGELTAGYYNTYYHNGYDPIMDVLKRNGARLSFTCVEMRDCEHPPDACCSPQGLLQQVMESSQRKDVKLTGENALQRYDEYALSRIMESAFGDYARSNTMEQITFLRMADVMFDNWNTFQNFLVRMNSRAS